MDFTKNTAEEFLSTLSQLNEFYKLFTSFNGNDIPEERRDIILENLTFQMLKAEKEYTQKCIRN
jgi:hypothetical protein